MRDLTHAFFAEWIDADEDDTQDSTHCGQPAEEHLDAIDGLHALHLVGLEAEISQKPTCQGATDGPTELLAHGRGREDKACGTVAGLQFRIVGAVGIHGP